MVKVTAKCFIQRGSIEEFKKHSSRLIDETRKEEGCLAYELYQDVNEETVFFFIEGWEDSESLSNHINSKHFKEIFPKIEKLCFKKIELNSYALVK